VNPSTKIRLLLVDDHLIMRLGLVTAINQEPDMVVAAQCGSGEQAIELFAEHRPDVTVMDLRLPGISGIEATTAIRSSCLEARIVLFSNYETEEDVFRATEAGVVAYLAKSADPTELIAAVRIVQSGRTYFPETISAKLATRGARPQLTDRELDILRLIVLGRCNKEIAAELKIAANTVRNHLSNLMQKLGVRDRTEAATMAIQRGMIRFE
jgi:two-component system NarL family response regulator